MQEGKKGWAGALKDEDRIRYQFEQYISRPLLNRLVDSEARCGGRVNPLNAPFILTIAGCAALIAIAVKCGSMVH